MKNLTKLTLIAVIGFALRFTFLQPIYSPISLGVIRYAISELVKLEKSESEDKNQYKLEGGKDKK